MEKAKEALDLEKAKKPWKRPRSIGKGKEALEKAKEALENVALWKRPK